MRISGSGRVAVGAMGLASRGSATAGGRMIGVGGGEVVWCWLPFAGLDLGVRSGAIGPVNAGAGPEEGVADGCAEDGGGVGMEGGSGIGLVMGMGLNGDLAMCQRSSLMVRRGGCGCTGMYFLKNLRSWVVLLPKLSTRTMYRSNW